LLSSRDPLGSENPLRSIYEQLIEIKGNLQDFQILPHWSISGESLVPYQIKLGKIDDARVDGKFLAPDGSIPPGQGVLHLVLHQCYRMVFKLQSRLAPVGEDLLPLYNQLITLKKCLEQLEAWDVDISHAELIPYQVKLQSVSARVYYI
jgi:hypothetical protein